MTPKWMKQIPPYEGDQPYLYLAFAEEDSGRVWKLLQPLLARGCRVWYCVGPASDGRTLRGPGQQKRRSCQSKI